MPVLPCWTFLLSPSQKFSDHSCPMSPVIIKSVFMTCPSNKGSNQPRYLSSLIKPFASTWSFHCISIANWWLLSSSIDAQADQQVYTMEGESQKELFLLCSFYSSISKFIYKHLCICGLRKKSNLPPLSIWGYCKQNTKKLFRKDYMKVFPNAHIYRKSPKLRLSSSEKKRQKILSRIQVSHSQLMDVSLLETGGPILGVLGINY